MEKEEGGERRGSGEEEGWGKKRVGGRRGSGEEESRGKRVGERRVSRKERAGRRWVRVPPTTSGVFRL